MLPAADVLSLPTEGASVLVDTITTRAYNLALLVQLHLEGDSSKWILDACLPWLLERAKNLSLLDAHLGSNPRLPPLIHIMHLILMLPNNFGNVFRALPHVARLETLSMLKGTCCIAENSIGIPLDLSMLPCLVSVALTAIVPAKIILPADCKVSLRRVHLQKFLYVKKMYPGKEAVVHSIGVGLKVSEMPSLRYVENLHALVDVTVHLIAADHSRDSVCKVELCCLQPVKRLQVSGENLDKNVPT